MKMLTVSCFGHRQIDRFSLVEQRTEHLLRHLMSKYSYIEFLVGKNGDFDQIVSSCVRKIRRELEESHILVLVLPYPSAEYNHNQESFEQYYDEIEICEQSVKAHYKSALQLRNRYMVNRSHLVITYVERKLGGAYRTLCYAKEKGKKIINLAIYE